MPPIVQALARLFEPDTTGINPDFITAWNAIPEIVKAHVACEDSSTGWTTRWSVIEEIVGKQIERSRASKEPYEHRLAQIVDILEAHNPDALTDLATTYTSPAFHIGLAFAAYVLTGGKE